MMKMFERASSTKRPLMPIDVIENTVDTIVYDNKQPDTRSTARAGRDTNQKRFVFMTR